MLVALTQEQAAAVDLVTAARPPRVSCITGGPGVGKTYTVRAIVEACARQGRKVALAAPSGKAALRLEEAAGRQAKTIHRLLGVCPGAESEPAPVDADVVVVDEASMVDTYLMEGLMLGCFGGGGDLHRTQSLVLVGDADQLPPVGPGQPFHDLLGSGAVPHARLTQIQRTGEGSGISWAAARIREGKSPQWTADCELVEVEKAEDVPRACWEAFVRLGGYSSRTQVLIPQKDRAAGVHAVNVHMESGGPPPADPGLLRDKFRRGTKVIHTKNAYDMGEDGIFNGELGYVVSVHEGKGARRQDDSALVDIAGQRIRYAGSQLKWLQPAWAITVHKSQGSEWEDVIVVCHPTHSFMLSRSLLYVALTRARKRVVVIGTQGAVDLAVRKVKDLRRRTQLRRWLEGGRE